MKLWTYIGKNVLVTLKDGQEFIGKVTNYDDEVENESGEDSINMAVGKLLYDFDESEIKSIEILYLGTWTTKHEVNKVNQKIIINSIKGQK